MQSPFATYEERQRHYAQRIAAEERTDALVANLRLGIFLVGLGTLLVALFTHAFAWLWVGVPGALFGVLVVWHAHVLNTLAEERRRHTYYSHGLLRLAHEAPPGASDGSHHCDAEHPYAADLDLFGPGGLFVFLCTARSRAGEATLARWLLAPADVSTVAQRQRMVQELRSHLQLREDLACLGEDMRLSVHPQTLTAWAEGQRLLPTGAWRVALFTCNGALLIAAAAWQFLGTGPLPFLAVVLVGWSLARLLRDRTDAVMAALEQPGRELALLAQVVTRLHKESFEGADLRALQERLEQPRRSAAAALASLGTLTDLYDAHKNQAFAPLAWLALWAPHFAYTVEAWRARHGADVRGWLETLGELEALASLGCYAFERPDDIFPTVAAGPACIQGKGLAHPLLPKAVRNDITLNTQHPLLMVSGSNMSGKSTFLRTVGINTVLALAGAPVRARSLELTPLAVGATLRVQDSLQRGTSRFYAEIRRLQQLMDVTRGPLPMLFLLDEVLAGTNSHDRAIGAAAVIQSYLQHGALGLVTTHDLALAQANTPWRAQAVNVHFVDDLLDGKLHFDYQVRPGVVQHSNALALMRSMGLYNGDLPR